MKKKMLIITLLISSVFINSCVDKKMITAKKGVIDLSDWDFEKDGIVRLDGEWEFYNNKLLTPDDFKNIKTPFFYTNIPKRWRNTGNDKNIIGRYGFATYRLKILLNNKNCNFGLRVPTSYVAYTIWINNKYKFNQGSVADNIKKEIPRSFPRDFIFNTENQNEIDIIIQNSNFHDESGGFLNNFILGKSEQILNFAKNNLAADLFLFGAIIIFALYNLILFLFNKKDISPLILCALCFTVSIRTLFVNESFIYNVFPYFDFEIARKLEYLTVCIGPYLLVSFIHKQFLKYSIKKVVITSKIIAILYSFFVIFTSLKIYSYLLVLFQIKMVIDFIYIIGILTKAMRKREIEAFISFGGFIFAFFIIVYEILYHHQIFMVGVYTPIGVLIFMFSQSFILSLRLARAYSSLENISSELRIYSKELEEKVQERTHELEEANEEKINFFINLAHEMKTPLTLMSNYFEGYIKKVGSFPETIIIKENLDKLTRDMVNILDVEKLAKGQIYYDHSMIINLTDIINKKISLFKEVTDRKGIKIYESIKKNIYIKIDAFAIDRILNNLLDNAIKYNKPNGEIRIILKNNKKNIILIISDTGIGIDIEQQKNIFDPYYQLSHNKRNVYGIGIGLSIVKRIMDEIDGEINIKSELNKGTEFTIKFKEYHLKRNDIVNTYYEISKPIKNTFNVKLKETVPQKNKYNILVVDDNYEMLLFLQNTMMEEYNFYYALNGKEALKKLNNIAKPDIIISDIMMDVMDGYEFYENISNNSKYNTIPFIFLTAKSTYKDRIKGLLKGAIDFISKPFIIDELLAKINSIIVREENSKNKMIRSIQKKIYVYFSNKNKGKSHKRKEITKEKNIADILLNKYQISKREVEIIDLLIQGLLYKEIAYRLNISINTVRTHVKSIYHKFKIQNKSELSNIIHSLKGRPKKMDYAD